MSGEPRIVDATSPGGRAAVANVARAAGACVGYGALAAFLYLIGMQLYHWFREGEWTHIGISDAMHEVLIRCCVKDGDTGRLASLVHWLDAPVDWLGLHKVLEAIPATLAVFAVSILGNSLFVYFTDRIAERAQPEPPAEPGAAQGEP